MSLDITQLLDQLRLLGKDNQICEVKESVKRLPDSIVDSISAFSNRNGGTIILGLSEKTNFRPTPGFNAEKIYAAMLTAGDQLTPVVRPDVEIFPYEDAQIVVARIFPLKKEELPCYVTAQGAYQGAYIRTGDGDRHLTRYEIDRLMEYRGQPKFDLEAVPDATLEDLDKQVVSAVISRNRDNSPRSLGRMTDEEILIRLGAAARINGVMHPTLGALLAMGIYPQQFFPRLNVTLTIYPGTQKASQAMRYLDTKSFNGAVPEILHDASAYLRQNIKTGALIEGTLRQDVSEYPLVAFREALVNALQHRDYSPAGRGAQVQVNLYADRLEILNPGGLFGAASLDTMDIGISATRNVNLSRLLESVPYEEEGIRGYVIENRGTGIPVIKREMAQALMPPPKFNDYISAFQVTLSKRRLSEEEQSAIGSESFEKALIAQLLKCETLSISEIQALSGLSRGAVFARVKKLLQAGMIEPTEPRRSPKQRYRLKR